MLDDKQFDDLIELLELIEDIETHGDEEFAGEDIG